MNGEFKHFITCVLWAIALGMTIAASVGAIEYGLQPDNGFHLFAGIINLLGWGGWLIYNAVKYLKAREAGNDEKNEEKKTK